MSPYRSILNILIICVGLRVLLNNQLGWAINYVGCRAPLEFYHLYISFRSRFKLDSVFPAQRERDSADLALSAQDRLNQIPVANNADCEDFILLLLLWILYVVIVNLRESVKYMWVWNNANLNSTFLGDIFNWPKLLFPFLSSVCEAEQWQWHQ